MRRGLKTDGITLPSHKMGGVPPVLEGYPRPHKWPLVLCE
jgi:hypothetical protein